LDYIACWFLKGALYIKNFSNSRFAFVSTSSICQGEQVSILWPNILNKNLEIEFAYQPFEWENNAKRNAGVICSIIGIRNISDKRKSLFKDGIVCAADNINPYLMDYKNIIIEKRKTPLGFLPQMSYGNKAVDDGNLLFSEEDKREITKKHPNSIKFIKKAVGSEEFIKRINRWCLWISDETLINAKNIPEIKNRIDNVRKFRAKSKKNATQESSKNPHRFGEVRFNHSKGIIVPRVSSDRREFIPVGFLDKNTIILDSAQAIYDVEPYVFGVISSKMHLAWVKITSGKLKNDYRYSSALSYNTFPFFEINKSQKEQIKYHVQNILEERERHPEKIIAELYDPKKMPTGLREAHQNLDAAIERCYRSKPFESDEERLKHLFKLYEEMIHSEKKRK